MVKPEFFRDKKIGVLGPTTALVFEALWCVSDDGGVAPCEADQLKGEMFTRWPMISVDDIEASMVALRECGIITTYEIGEDRFAVIHKFQRHQTINNPSRFRNPVPTDGLPQPSSTTHSPKRIPKGSPKVIPAPKIPSASPDQKQQQADQNGTKPQRMTWLTPYFDAWRAQYGADPHAGKLSKFIRPVDKEFGPEYAVPRWTRYLAETEAQFASPARWAETHGSWDPANKKEEPMSDLGVFE